MDTTPLLDWLARQGATIDSVALEPAGHVGRLVRATADIAEGQTLVSVPHPAILTLEMARKSPVGRQLLAADIEAPGGHAFLAAFLLVESRRPASPFAPYLRTLPRTFPTVPLYHHKRLAPVLQGSFAGELMARRRDSLVRDFIALRREIPALRDMSMREFFWARTIVITRVFGVKIRGASTEILVPFADMLNHKRPPDAEWNYEDDRRCFEMKATRNIRAGEEVCDSYGRKPNGRFFVHYGFAMDGGVDDEIEIRLALPARDPLRARKAALLGRRFEVEAPYRVTNRIRGDETQRALSFMRIACAVEGELGRASRYVRDDKPVPPLSLKGEAAALAMLDAACEQALSRFETPDEADDVAQLAAPDLDVNVRNALLVRRGEKRLLRAYRRLAAASIPLLALSRKDFFTAAVHHAGENLTMSYLFDTALALAPREARPPSFRSVGL